MCREKEEKVGKTEGKISPTIKWILNPFLESGEPTQMKYVTLDQELPKTDCFKCIMYSDYFKCIKIFF